jgi:hypothetical protein
MPDACFSPGRFAPDGGPLLSPGQWSAIQAFGSSVAGIDVPAMAVRLQQVLVIRPGGWGASEFLPPYVPDPAQVAQATAQIQPLLAILTSLQPQTVELLEFLRHAQTLGQDLAGFARDAVRQLTVVGDLVSRADPDPALVVAALEPLQTLAGAHAAAARTVSDSLEQALRRTTDLLAALGSGIASADAALQSQAYVPWGQGSFFIESTLQPVDTQLQALAPQLEPGVAQVAGAWNAIALELGAVIERAGSAGAAAVLGEPCLAAASLAIAVDEWTAVAADVDAFLRGLTTTAAAAGVVL